MTHPWLARSWRYSSPDCYRCMFFSLVIPVALVAVIALTGCDRNGRWEKVIVEGDVTYDGNKVLNGDIRFIPTSASMGPTAGAEIIDGHFRLTNKGGVPVGTHRVALRAFIIDGIGSASGEGESGDLLAGPRVKKKKREKPSIPIYMVEGRPQFLPPIYNKKSPLTVEITGKDNPQIENFNMRSEK